MTKRITVPEEHIALVLPQGLALDLMSICQLVRQLGNGRGSKKVRLELADKSEEAGRVILALLEARALELTL